MKEKNGWKYYKGFFLIENNYTNNGGARPSRVEFHVPQLLKR